MRVGGNYKPPDCLCRISDWPCRHSKRLSGVKCQCKVERMKTWPLPLLVSCAPALAITMFVVSMANPLSALCQNLEVQRNNCAVSESLGPIHFSASTIDWVSIQ